MKRESKGFFFEPFCAARFRLRGYAAQSSGRENQKTFVSLGHGIWLLRCQAACRGAEAWMAASRAAMTVFGSAGDPKESKSFCFFFFRKRSSFFHV